MTGPTEWGPFGWKFIHYITLGYPNNPTALDKQKYMNFFNSLQYVLPCSICSAHFQENLKLYPLTYELLSDKMKFIEWGILMHNLVNISNKKKEYTMDEGLKEIEKNNLEDMKQHIHNAKEEHDIKISTKSIPTKSISHESIEGFDSTPKKSILTYILFIIILILVIYIILNYIKNTYKK